ncbi:hypothetical protein GHK45_22305 [Sinorhizobium meliloti]|uniref:Uncharacterized protein n=1 Tax=Rhizobium meliloti TaxID=382 RepID=A0A6A7ZW25_RHIML|nr:hypothetical protein [Sinorhizobium meliloti]MQW06358.1 hypothetical protein [Sinorhizobium meliloti]
MNGNINLNGPRLADFLGRIGLPASARERVIAIDRTLAKELASDHPDVDGCASLVIEAADLIADRDPAGFDWNGWDNGWDDDNPEDADSFDLDSVDWGEE